MIKKIGKKFPFLDIYSVIKRRDQVYIPDDQLLNGHIKEFKVAHSSFVPFQKMNVKFSGDSLKDDLNSSYSQSEIDEFDSEIEVFTFKNSHEILINNYGNFMNLSIYYLIN